MDRGPLFLALDQGGSASRALVFDDAGREVASARVDVADRRPRPGWVEQDPDAVADSLRQVAEAAMASLDAAQRARVAACGLSCQRSSLVCWDRASGAALSPVLSWQDTRAADWLAAQALDVEAIRATTGLTPNAHFGLSKMRWCLDHLDAVKQAAADGRLVIGSLAAFLAFRLLEQRPCRVDPANASRTLLFDLGTGDWSDALLARFGIERRWLPAIARSDAHYGDLVLSSRRLPLRLLSGDQSTAAFAYGELRGEAAYLNVGTGAFVYRLGRAAPAGSRLLRSVVHWSDAPQYVVEGTVNGAGSALAWFAQEHAIADVGAALEAAWTNDGAGDTVFLNGIGGLGSPDWRAGFASRFIDGGESVAPPQPSPSLREGEGVDSSLRETDAGRLVAVAESIVFLVERNLGLLQSVGARCEVVLVSGGLSRSDRFCQALADVSGVPVRRPAQCEASARGCAFLLAGRPAAWAPVDAQGFAPRVELALQARHRRWSDAMASALLSPG
jgi:glycerol kinase